MTKAQKAARDAARKRLREILKPGTTLYTTLRHVSRSGMMRVIDLYVIEEATPLRLSMTAAEAIGARYNRTHDGVQVGGCGMDAGFEVVYNLGSVLYPDGYGCIGEGCQSNDHSNGDRDYTPHVGEDHHRHWHGDGGYAFRHRWLS